MLLNDLIQCLIGPRLYRIYSFRDTPGRPYIASRLEIYCDNFIQLLSAFRYVAIYSSPVVVTYLYAKGNLLNNSNNRFMINITLIRIAVAVGFAFFGAYFLRGISRLANNDYTRFLSILKDSRDNVNARITLTKFEFEFEWWPIDYRWNESTLSTANKPPQLLMLDRPNRRGISLFDKFKKLPCDLLSYIVVHTIGRRMLYPGSVAPLQLALHNTLIEGRTNLIERHNGSRHKLLARDGNHIDCLFIDKRTEHTINGRTLVIGSEGNAGFYEIGSINTPLGAGYSVLGWNHPGFGGSTGLPFPINDINAIDVVMQFAIEKLGFKVEDIILYAWSIGGFPSAWAAMQYPEIKGLILDASFDDILPLAEAKMPQSWKSLVRNTIRTYFNLNNSAYLSLYDGPVLLIRRLRDEIIITNDAQSLNTNRCNDLLTKLLQNRFPKLMAEENVRLVLKQWLTSDPQKQALIQAKYDVRDDICLAYLQSYVESNGAVYPLHIGDDDDINVNERIKLILFLAQKHLRDFDSTHCTPLPPNYIQHPFDLFANFRNRISNKL